MGESVGSKTRLFSILETSQMSPPGPPPRSATVGRDRTAVVLCPCWRVVLLGLLVVDARECVVVDAVATGWFCCGLPSAHSSRDRENSLLPALIVGSPRWCSCGCRRRNASRSAAEWSPTTFQAGPELLYGNRANASEINEPLVLDAKLP